LIIKRNKNGYLSNFIAKIITNSLLPKSEIIGISFSEQINYL